MVLNKLQEAMQSRELTVAELAAKTMMSTRTIENAKSKKGVSLNTGKRIALSLKMKLEDLV